MAEILESIGNSGIARKLFLGDANRNGSYENRDAALISRTRLRC